MTIKVFLLLAVYPMVALTAATEAASLPESGKITVTTDYYWCVLMATLLSLFVTASCMPISGLRKKYFTAEFLEENFGKEHREAFGEDSKVPKNGYPDCGDGRYSSKLTYYQWFNFGNAQRVHQNNIEQLPIYLVNVLLGGLFNPRVAAVYGLLVLFARIEYTRGYLKSGANGRVIGAIGAALSTVVFLFYNCWVVGGVINRNNLWY
jgi:uncharacterized membrane protein YecN with MAPEG domain